MFRNIKKIGLDREIRKYPGSQSLQNITQGLKKLAKKKN